MQESGRCFISPASIRYERPISICSSGLFVEVASDQKADPKNGYPEAGLAALAFGDLTKPSKLPQRILSDSVSSKIGVPP